MLQLAQPAFVHQLVLEHIPYVISARNSAVRQFKLTGFRNNTEAFSFKNTFAFGPGLNHIQSFSVPKSSLNALVDRVRFDILNNHGDSEFTCLYRIRLFGANSQKELKSE